MRDQVHMNVVRDALWSRPVGAASVMVGAGFSKNAHSAKPGMTSLPSWEELATAISRQLYPPCDCPEQRKEVPASDSTRDFLSRAQEFETAFGRNALLQLLRQLIPDTDFRPSELHTRLLGLPWSQVFTTNWDTLLERTTIPGRSYDTVQTVGDISSARPPRIVKLHGSFSADSRLTITEEDYRKYPNDFAPFVNTAQQAMMETVFLLIGFSGNDPNFLHWSGWVRDNLGDSRPPMYLAGWLELSDHRRQVLIERRVIPIDLADHPRGSTWPEHLRDRYAVDWVLRTLEYGEPYDVTDWPTPSHRRQIQVPDHFRPLDVPVATEPLAESSRPERGANSSAVAKVDAILEISCHNRAMYPGWLMIPAAKRHSMRMVTDAWEKQILDVVNELEWGKQLAAIDELVWRRRLLLDPLSRQLEEAVAAVLQTIDCETRTIRGEALPSVAWGATRAAWRRLGLALLTAARFRLDAEAFDFWMAALAPFLGDDGDIRHAVQYEQCLWTLWRLDLHALGTLLHSWVCEECDPVWMMRKATLLLEINASDQAERLLTEATADIYGRPSNDESLAAASREGWALLLQDALAAKPPSFRGSVPSRRWAELALLKCDPREDRRRSSDDLREMNPIEEKPVFDYGTSSESITFSNEPHRRLQAAYRSVRLTEVAGLPSIVNFRDVSKGLLTQAADVLIESNPGLAARLVLRICRSDQDPLLLRVFSRSRVAFMPEAVTKSIHGSAINLIEHASGRITETRELFWIERLRVGIEVLSRITLRCTPDQVGTIFDRALSDYARSPIANHHLMAKPLRRLLWRSWGALPVPDRTERILDLLTAPIRDGASVEISSALDASELLLDPTPPPTRTSDNDTRWAQAGSTIAQALRVAGEARSRGAIRAGYAGLPEHLTPDELGEIAEALWHSDFTEPDALPSGTNLYDWSFLFLPETRSGDAGTAFRRKWLSLHTLENLEPPTDANPHVFSFSNSNRGNPTNVDDIIYQVGSAIQQSEARGQPFTISEEDLAVIVRVIDHWCDLDVPRPPPDFHGFATEDIRETVAALASVLAAIPISKALGERIYEKVRQLHDARIPAFELIGALVQILPTQTDELVMLLKIGLVSDEAGLADAAGQGLRMWLQGSRDSPSTVAPPPTELLREVGVAIATRRGGMLQQALEIATWVFARGEPVQREAIESLTLEGLGYLREELRYDRLQRGQFAELDVPKLRWLSVRLAMTMAELGLAQDPVIVDWLQIRIVDPLPEVRHASPLG
ncbi:MAG: SIR2 family protein [Gemmatimonadetes bacterium]|nr:SIR2 family protein [Gemmatimonadota bacterium]